MQLALPAGILLGQVKPNTLAPQGQDLCWMPTINLDLVAERLFENPRIGARIAADYGLVYRPAMEMAAAMVAAFGQDGAAPNPSPNLSNRVVFRAAVRALASNSRSWSTFLRFETRLESLVAAYDPEATSAAHAAGHLEIAQIAQCLPGPTSSADAKAMMAWADLLSQTSDYYTSLEHLRHVIAKGIVSQEEVVPMVATVLGVASPRIVRLYPTPPNLASWKLPGMGAVLGSEFLRNLYWRGFKPDRHIKRLLGMWFHDTVRSKAVRATQLAGQIGCARKDVIDFLTFSLVGAAVTPAGHSFTEVDNLMWALGAYVEKKGKESPTNYRLD